jgi:hypothetical protein
VGEPAIMVVKEECLIVGEGAQNPHCRDVGGEVDVDADADVVDIRVPQINKVTSFIKHLKNNSMIN